MTNELDKSVKFIAIYARVSTARQEEDRTIEAQLSAVKEYAQKNNYKILREYIDDGWSGDSLVRPGLDELRQDAKAKKWDAVLMYDPDRLARRYSYQELVMDELKESGVEVMFVTVSSPKNNDEKILHGVRGLFAEYERAKIIERFRLGKISKIRSGNVMASEAPYGYDYVSKRDGINGHYIINEEEARVIKMIFSWVADNGFTMRALVRKLQELGIRPRKSKRAVWSTSTLSTLLGNEVYIGNAHYGRTCGIAPKNPTSHEKYRKVKKSSRVIRPKSEWQIISVPAIITKELFMRARARIEQNFKFCDRNKKNEYLLAGKIWCDCGRRRSGEGAQRGKHLYYRCTDRVLSFPLPPTCKLGGVNARIADKLLWDKVSHLMSSPGLLEKQLERWLKDKIATKTSPSADVEVINKEIEKAKAQEDRYSKAYGDGMFSLEQLKGHLIPIRERLASLNAKLAESLKSKETELQPKLPNQEEIEVFAQKAAEKLKNLSFIAKREIVMSVVEKITGTKEKLQVYGYIPISLNHVESFTNSRHCRPSERR